MRLSRKASELAHKMADTYQRHIRREAANRAKNYMKEFADETDVIAASQDFILIVADEIRRPEIKKEAK